MTQIFVMKRRAGIEYQIPVWNLGGFIETDRVENGVDPEKVDALEAILEVETI